MDAGTTRQQTPVPERQAGNPAERQAGNPAERQAGNAAEPAGRAERQAGNPAEPAGRADFARGPDAGRLPEDSLRVLSREHVEHFFPVRKAELVELLLERCQTQEEADGFRQLCRLLDATFHHRFRERLEGLKNAYASFDPDTDTPPLRELDEGQREQRAAELFESFEQILERANYRRLDQDDLQRALDAASYWGIHLDVDFGVFEKLDVYARGSMLSTRQRRHPLIWYRVENVEIPIFQRLVIAFRLRKTPRPGDPVRPDAIYLKIFKNIPQVDLDMLLPGSRIKMSHLDHGKIWLPTVSGAAIAVFKLVKGVALLATLTLYNVVVFLGLVGGMVGYGVKSLMGYLRTKDKYQLNLTRQLYYQNLDNNAGVLYRLLDEAEEQELREVLLSYFVLWKSAPASGLSQGELDREAERVIRDMTGLRVDFEVDDAVRKLQRLGLASRDDDGRWKATPPDEALRRLDNSWDCLFEFGRDERSARAPAGDQSGETPLVKPLASRQEGVPQPTETGDPR